MDMEIIQMQASLCVAASEILVSQEHTALSIQKLTRNRISHVVPAK